MLSASRSVGVILDSPKPPPQRITLTLPVLNSAKHIVFVVTGESKASVLSEILDKQSAAYPAGQITGNVTWVLDTLAASKLRVE